MTTHVYIHVNTIRHNNYENSIKYAYIRVKGSDVGIALFFSFLGRYYNVQAIRSYHAVYIYA